MVSPRRLTRRLICDLRHRVRRTCRVFMWYVHVHECTHNSILVEESDTRHSCEDCGARLKYVKNDKADIWTRPARDEWRKWFGPHWDADLVVDWPATRTYIRTHTDCRER